MTFEPQKFFIGLIDFFSILLPGALLTYLLRQADPALFFGLSTYLNKQGTEGALVFLFSCYVLGHFLFLVGSLLDDWLYDPIRTRTEEKQIENLLRGRKRSPAVVRWLAARLFKSSPNRALNRVVAIKDGYLKRIDAPGAINAFQWCKLRLLNENPEALLLINRFEANSKFFRSFIPVLGLIAFSSLGRVLFADRAPGSPFRIGDELSTAIAVLFLVLATWRYMEQRFKATQHAYWAVLTAEAQADRECPGQKPVEKVQAEEIGEKATHAGGVVYRQASDRSVSYLLVQARQDPSQWVLPKGHIEPGESEPYCAIREVREETGVWATIPRQRTQAGEPGSGARVDLGVIPIVVDAKTIRVRFFLMKYLDQGKPRERRKRKWLPHAEAMKAATHEESQRMLAMAEKRRTALLHTEAQ